MPLFGVLLFGVLLFGVLLLSLLIALRLLSLLLVLLIVSTITTIVRCRLNHGSAHQRNDHAEGCQSTVSHVRSPCHAGTRGGVKNYKTLFHNSVGCKGKLQAPRVLFTFSDDMPAHVARKAADVGRKRHPRPRA